MEITLAHEGIFLDWYFELQEYMILSSEFTKERSKNKKSHLQQPQKTPQQTNKILGMKLNWIW